LSRQIGLRQKGQRNGPRVHDLRHRFAVQTLINWYRAGLDIEQQLPVLSTFLGHAYVRDTYWYLSATPELMSHAARRLDKRWGTAMTATSDLPALIERWFTDRLIRHRGASANTIASYRDTFRLLFAFAQGRLRRPPSKLSLTDLDAPFICAFLDDLEMRRSATARTRNLRLTAIRSFFRYASFEAPAHSAHIQRVLAIPTKRCDKRQLHFLTRIEIDAISLVPTSRPGSDGAITHCCCSPCKRACGFRSWSGWTAMLWLSAAGRMSDASERDARNDARH
jgi:site-specific recombinase XerD